MEATEVLQALRILLLAGFGFSAILAIVVLRGDADANWHRRYLDEHPGLRTDFEVWRKQRRRELLRAAGRCPDHLLILDASGKCGRCGSRPGGES